MLNVKMHVKMSHRKLKALGNESHNDAHVAAALHNSQLAFFSSLLVTLCFYIFFADWILFRSCDVFFVFCFFCRMLKIMLSMHQLPLDDDQTAKTQILL